MNNSQIVLLTTRETQLKVLHLTCSSLAEKRLGSLQRKKANGKSQRKTRIGGGEKNDMSKVFFFFIIDLIKIRDLFYWQMPSFHR